MTIYYDSKNHFGVIFALKGTVWMSVLPFCLLNVIVTISIYGVSVYLDVDLRFQEGGMTILTTLVAFLVVSRTSCAYSRFWTARDHVTKLLIKSYQIALLANSFTAKPLQDADVDLTAKKKVLIWRNTVKCRLISLISATTDILRHGEMVRHLEEGDTQLSFENEMKCTLFGNKVHRCFIKSNDLIVDPSSIGTYLHDVFESNKRFLDDANCSLLIQREIALHNLIGQLLDNYKLLCNFITTPYPFPLVQMTKALILLWLFLLPFYMLHGNYSFVGSVSLGVAIFFMTYGFFGLECVAMELDDPFGDDCNDIELKRLGKSIIIDISNVLENDPSLFVDHNFKIKLDFETLSAGVGKQIRDDKNRVFDRTKILDMVKIPIETFSEERPKSWENLVPGFLDQINAGESCFAASLKHEGVIKFEGALQLLRQHHGTGISRDKKDYYEASILFKIGEEYFALKEYDAALNTYEILVLLLNKAGGQRKIMINILCKLGILYYLCGHYEKCEESFKNSLLEIKDFVEDHNELVAPILYNSGVACTKMLHYDWAMTCFLECLHLQKHMYGINHKDVARTLFQIATLHFICGDIHESCRAFELTLQIQVRIENITIDEITITIDALCSSFSNELSVLPVLDNVYRFLLKRQHSFQPTILLSILLRVGNVYRSDDIKALPFYELALSHYREKIKERVNNSDLITLYTRLGYINYRMKKYEPAQGLLTEALRIVDKENDAVGLTKIEILTTLGSLCVIIDQVEDANEALEEGLHLLKVSPNISNKKKGTLFQELGKQYLLLKDFVKGIECIDRAIDFLRADGENNNVILSESLSILADAYVEINKEELAFVYYEESIRLAKSLACSDINLDKKDRYIFKAAGLATKLGKKDRALSLYSEITNSLSNESAQFYAHISICYVLSTMEVYEEASSQLENAIQLCKSDFDREVVSVRRRDLASQLFEYGKSWEALELLQNNKLFLTALCGGQHIEVVLTLIESASIHVSIGNIDHSIQDYVEALALLKSFTWSDKNIPLVFKLTQDIEVKLNHVKMHASTNKLS